MVAATLIGLLMAANIPPALMARSDEAAAAYVQCLFGVVRQANAAHLSQSAFEQRFAASCHAEQSAQRALGLRILRLRGEPSPEASVDELDRQVRQGMIEDYRTLPEKQRALEQLEALCKAQPAACQ
jgi:hypothetical protein